MTATATTSQHVSTTHSDDWGDFVAASASTPSPNSLVPSNQPLQGFDTLDQVQRYALGALAVVLLNHHATDLNGAAFARTHASTILQALDLTPGQQTALLALETTPETRHHVVSQCVDLVGHDEPRFLALQAMLALSVAAGNYDARSRAFLAAVAAEFGITWRAVAAVELAIAIHLFENIDREAHPVPPDPQPPHSDGDIAVAHTSSPRPKSVDQLLIERRKKKMRLRKAMKISGITLVGGMLFGLTGGLIAPALLSALAGVGVASAAGLAASGTLASGAVVGGLFGVAGAGFTVKKARNRISTNLEEFDFERPDDPRVLEARRRKEERQRKKLEKLVAQRLLEDAAANEGTKQIEAPSSEDAANGSASTSTIDAEKELPRPPESSDDDEEDDDEHTKKSRKRFGTRKKKHRKQKVGARGLEAAGQIPSLHVCICVPAWLTEKAYGAALDQFEPGLKVVLPCSQHIALRWESRRLYEMGLAFAKFWASKATVTTIQQAYPHAVAAASTVAGAVAFAFALPLTIMSCLDYIDNPWSILVSRSNGAGEELADVLVERSYGHRPVSLFGYSIGARVIFKCLESLASRGALGIVDNVFLMGAAITADPQRWKKIRRVVAGRIVNAYGSHDWALAFFHRGCGHGVFVSGLRRVEVEGVENLNMAYLGMEGHRELKACVPRVMRAMGLGVGYIVMPPARLVYRKRKSKGQQRSGGSPVCEDPAAGEDSSDSLSTSPSELKEQNGHLRKMRNDKFWSPDELAASGKSDGFEGVDSVVLPPAIGSEDLLERSQDEVLSLATPSERKGVSKDVEKKKKSKSWLSWSAWSTSSSKSKKAHPKKSAEMSPRTMVREDNEQTAISGQDLDDTSDDIPIVDSTALNGAIEHGGGVEGVAIDAGEIDTLSEALEVECDEDGETEAFDWEKQRRIWEEQERQMQERGYADSAEEIEMQGKIVLNIGVEVAGRRIARFMEQDEELPVAKREEIYTNCVEDQRGVLIRIYEHERRTKSVPINMLEADEQYPKLLGELEVRLSSSAEKGKLRIAVAMECDENGDVYGVAEERFSDGSTGDRSEICIPRGDLCTMSERRRLETAERKRLEARIQKEMRNRNSQSVPALPAPESFEADDTGALQDVSQDGTREERDGEKLHNVAEKDR